jgi:hypothetical protein
MSVGGAGRSDGGGGVMVAGTGLEIGPPESRGQVIRPLHRLGPSIAFIFKHFGSNPYHRHIFTEPFFFINAVKLHYFG